MTDKRECAADKIRTHKLQSASTPVFRIHIQLIGILARLFKNFLTEDLHEGHLSSEGT
jgi:hypothetical protein